MILKKYKYELAFIIPAYNIGKYISKSIDSILKQTEVNFQIIIINDGSNDNTMEVCRNYLNKHEFISIVNKKNEGVSIARNLGISLADANYICFMDGDDFYLCDFAKEFLKVCYKYNLDIIRGRYKLSENNLIYPKKYPRGIICKEEPLIGNKFLNKFLNLKYSEVVPWLGFFKTDFLYKNKLIFPCGIDYTEDQLFYLSALNIENCKVMDVDVCFYAYCIRENSATNSGYSIKKVSDIFEVCFREIELINKYPDNEKDIYKYASTTLSQIFPFYKKANREQKKYILKELKKILTNELIKNTYSNKIKIKFILAKYFSMLLDIIY